jgi:uncharacterized protein YegL
MTNPNYTHLALVVDRSGSMSGIAQDMNGGIDKLLSDQAEGPSTVKVDVCTFDSVAEYVATDADPLALIGQEYCNPRGMTALNDAIGLTIQRLGNKFKTMKEADRPGNVIVVVITDGHENSSREYTADDVKKMVSRQTDEWGWTFMYLAANVDAFATGSNLGFAPGQTMSYAGSGIGTSNAWAASSSNIARTIAGDQSGYTVDEREAAVQE